MAVNQLLLQVGIIRCPLYETPELILKILITILRRYRVDRNTGGEGGGICEESLQKMSPNGTSRFDGGWRQQDEKHGGEKNYAIILPDLFQLTDRFQRNDK